MSGLITAGAPFNTEGYSQPFSYRNPIGAYNNTTGKWEEDKGDTLIGNGSIQPVSKRDLHDLLSVSADGNRVSRAIIIFTANNLVADADPSGNATLVLYRGKCWRVIDIEDYSPHGHKECIAVEMREHPETFGFSETDIGFDQGNFS